MSAADAPPDRQEQLWRFLLDELSEPDRVALEDELLIDGDGFALVESAEDELIDAYVRDELSAERRLRFEQHFATTAARRTRVELARALATLATSTSAATATATQPAATATHSAAVTTARPLRADTATTTRRRPSRRLVLQVAAAAMLLGAFGTLAPRLWPGRGGTAVDATLYADAMRGDAAVTTVRLPAQASRLRLRLMLNEALLANGDSFDVLLRYEDEPAAPRRADRVARDALLVDLDGAQLRAGSYELTARAHRAGAVAAELAVYAFRVDGR